MSGFEEWVKANYTLEDRMTDIGKMADLRQAYNAGVAAERERCAKIVENFDTCMCCSEYDIAAEIRRGE